MTRGRRILLAVPVVLAAAVYVFTHFFRLEDFPIYYLFDEAIQVCHARDYVAAGFRGPAGERFPTFFPVAWDASICVSVYLQVLGVLVHGKSSIWVSRFVSALVGCLVPFGVAWAARSSLRLRWWWLGVLIVASLPTWFLHSRTALVVPFLVAFYAVMVAAYLAALTSSPKWLYVAALAGGLAYYSYASGQVVVPATAGLLVLVNSRFHVRHWRHSLGAALLSVLLLVPALLFRLHNPALLREQLQLTESPLLKLPDCPSRLEAVAVSYGQLMRPAYWFFDKDQPSRHCMAGYGVLPVWLFPLFVLGLAWTLWRAREAPYRSLVVVLFAALVAGAITAPEVWRVVTFVVPAALVLTVGLEAAIRPLSRVVPAPATAAAAAIALSGYSLYMLGDALRNGPTWFSDYGLYGTQWGARQLYAEKIPKFLAAHPGTVVSVTPHFANGGDVFPRFFGPSERVESGGIRPYLVPMTTKGWRPIPPNLVFVDLPEDLEAARASGRFSPVRVLDALSLPNGLPGFVFFEVAWAPDILETLVREESEQRKPVPASVTIGDLTNVAVLASRADIGSAQDAFDGDPDTLFRGAAANPFVVEFDLAGRRRLRGLTVLCGASTYRVSVSVAGALADAGRQETAQADVVEKEDRATARFAFVPILAGKVRVEILEKSTPPGESTNVHLYELTPELSGR